MSEQDFLGDRGLTFRGAYVQAWVWIDLEPEQKRLSDDEIRALAQRKWQDEGECEIDENAKVSRSYEG